MNFSNPNFLYLLAPCLLFGVFSYFRSERGGLSTSFRLLSFLALIFAFADPYYTETKFLDENEALALIDQSMSMSDSAIKDCENQISKEKAKKFKIKYFSREISDSKLSSRSYELTSFENSLRKAALDYPGGDLVICSDGFETAGNLDLVTSQIRSSFKSISILYPNLSTLKGDGVKIVNLSLPLKAKKSDFINLGFTLKNIGLSPHKDSVGIYVDSKLYREIQVKLSSQSEQRFDVQLTELKEGQHKVSVKTKAKDSEAASWISITETPKTILFSKNSGGNSSLLLERMLKAMQIDFEIHEPASYSSFNNISKEKVSGIILNNIKATDLSTKLQDKIASYVKDEGGGLLILGGDSSFGLGGYPKTVIESLSPLKSVPPRSKIARAPSAVVLLIDKSGSMGELGKLRSAKMAAVSSIYSLKPDDYVGVIGFDYAPLSIIELDKVEKVKQNAKERLANLTAYGQTNLLPGLSLARLRLSKITAGKKHLIILSDGQFPPSSDAFVAEINRLRADGITISTVALGFEADGPFMKMLAQAGKGSFYQTVDSSVLPKLFVDDIKVAVGEDTMKEESSYSIQATENDQKIFSLGRFPNLLGFVETQAKQGAETFLVTRKLEEVFPILAFWKRGKGQVGAFSSDLQGRWTSSWLKWPSFLTLWDHVVRKTLIKNEISPDQDKIDFQHQIAAGRIKLEAFVYDKTLESKLPSSISGGAYLNGKQISKFVLEEKVRGRFETYFNVTQAGDYDIKMEIGDEAGLKVAVLASDLGEVRSEGIDFNFLSKLQRSFNGSLGSISFENKNEQELSRTSRSPSVVIPLIFTSLFLLIFEVLIREGFIRFWKVKK